MKLAPEVDPRPSRVPKQELLSPKLLRFYKKSAGGRQFQVTTNIYSKGGREEVPNGQGRVVAACGPQAVPPRLLTALELWASSILVLLTPRVFWRIRISVNFSDFSEQFHFWAFYAMHRQNRQKLAQATELIGQSSKCYGTMVKTCSNGIK